jgi:hypothetical protein
MTASMFVPIAMNDAVLTASNIPEDDYAAWASGASYTAGDRVIRAVTHSVYEAATTGISNTAPESDAVMWIRVGATNRWRPFDGSIGQDASQSGTVTYTFTAPSVNDAIAFVGLTAVSVQVVVKDASSVVKYDETRQLVDGSNISSWLDFFTYETEFDDEQVFTDLPIFATYTVEVTIDGDGGAAGVGEIVFGKQVSLGKIVDGSRSGFTDYTTRTVDDFGNIELVQRPTARKAEWLFVFDTRSNRRIQKALESARGTKCFFYPGADMADFYLSVFGVADEFYPSLSAGGTTVDTLSLTGVS